MIARVLIVDDDQNFRGVLVSLVQQMGHSATAAKTLQDGIGRAQAQTFDVILLDVNLPDGSGLEAIPQFQKGALPPEIIIFTGFGAADGAELAIDSGAWDYVNKGTSLDAVKLSLTRAIQYREGRIKTAAPVALRTPGMIGASPSFTRCMDVLAQAAASNASVLITGETGTGKELFANAVHRNSAREQGSFVVVDCAALPETLVESVLFGHEKGAFTGADHSHEGLIKQADGGTLFLDEVGELPLTIQKSFLRALQERRFRPVGAEAEVASDFRLIAATNRDLDHMAGQGAFRRDLLFRLRTLAVELPPLRNRTEDIKPLAFHYVTHFCEILKVDPLGFSPDFLEALGAYEWPGNIRELANTIEGAIAAAGQEPILYPTHLPRNLRIHLARSAFPGRPAQQDEEDEVAVVLPEALPQLKEALADTRNLTERKYLQRLVAQTGPNIEEACRISGLSRSYLYKLLQRHNVSFPK